MFLLDITLVLAAHRDDHPHHDAVLAAIAAEYRCEVATLDRDFARFTSVRHVRLPI